MIEALALYVIKGKMVYGLLIEGMVVGGTLKYGERSGFFGKPPTKHQKRKMKKHVAKARKKSNRILKEGR